MLTRKYTTIKSAMQLRCTLSYSSFYMHLFFNIVRTYVYFLEQWRFLTENLEEVDLGWVHQEGAKFLENNENQFPC